MIFLQQVSNQQQMQNADTDCIKIDSIITKTKSGGNRELKVYTDERSPQQFEIEINTTTKTGEKYSDSFTPCVLAGLVDGHDKEIYQELHDKNEGTISNKEDLMNLIRNYLKEEDGILTPEELQFLGKLYDTIFVSNGKTGMIRDPQGMLDKVNQLTEGSNVSVASVAGFSDDKLRELNTVQKSV